MFPDLDSPLCPLLFALQQRKHDLWNNGLPDATNIKRPIQN